jgi:hypothetical protein
MRYGFVHLRIGTQAITMLVITAMAMVNNSTDGVMLTQIQ